MAITAITATIPSTDAPMTTAIHGVPCGRREDEPLLIRGADDDGSNDTAPRGCRAAPLGAAGWLSGIARATRGWAAILSALSLRFN